MLNQDSRLIGEQSCLMILSLLWNLISWKPLKHAFKFIFRTSATCKHRYGVTHNKQERKRLTGTRRHEIKRHRVRPNISKFAGKWREKMAGLSSIVFGVLMVALCALVQATPQPEQIHISSTGQLCLSQWCVLAWVILRFFLLSLNRLTGLKMWSKTVNRLQCFALHICQHFFYIYCGRSL